MKIKRFLHSITRFLLVEIFEKETSSSFKSPDIFSSTSGSNRPTAFRFRSTSKEQLTAIRISQVLNKLGSFSVFMDLNER